MARLDEKVVVALVLTFPPMVVAPLTVKGPPLFVLKAPVTLRDPATVTVAFD